MADATQDDRHAYANPDFEDRAWATYRLPRPAPPPGSPGVPNGTYWLRKTVAIPIEFRSETLALTLGTLHDAYDVFVNGKLAGRTFDRANVWSLQTARPRTFQVEPLGASTVTIAIRASDDRLLPNRIGSVVVALTQRPDEGPYLLTGLDNAPLDAAEEGQRRRLHTATPVLVESAAEGLLAFVVFLLYLNARESRELRVLGLLLAILGLLHGHQYGVVFFDLPKHALFLGSLLSAFVAGVLAWFVLLISGITARWPRYVIAGLCGIAIPLRPAVLVLPAYFLIPDRLLILGISLIALVWAVVGIVRSVRSEGWLGSQTWLCVIGLLLALVDHNRHPWVRVFPAYWSERDMVGDVLDIPVVFLSLAAIFVIVRRLGADRKEKQRLASELEAARLVQRLLVAPVQTGSRYTVEAAYLPAQEVGGDLYQVYVLANDELLLIAGDVSGKGLRAAMQVSLLIGAADNRRSNEPGEVLAELNRILAGRLDGGFVTCSCARFLADGSACVSSAGHPAPFVAGKEVEVPPGLPLGVVADACYEEVRIAGSGILTFVSDGVIEAANAKGELFGFERTRDVSAQSAQQIAEAARAWGQNDDITVVTVRRVS